MRRSTSPPRAARFFRPAAMFLLAALLLASAGCSWLSGSKAPKHQGYTPPPPGMAPPGPWMKAPPKADEPNWFERVILGKREYEPPRTELEWMGNKRQSWGEFR